MALGTQSGITLSGTDSTGNVHPDTEMVDHGKLVTAALTSPQGSVYTDAIMYSDGGCVDSAGC